MSGRPSRPLGARTLHVVVDMQRVFAEGTEWRVATIVDVMAPILALVRIHPQATLFTRFLTPSTIAEARGDWQRFYARWRSVVRDRMDSALLDLMAPLQGFVPPAEVCDKSAYSAFTSAPFVAALDRRRIETLVLSGVETDVCVLATALDAVDRGLHVVLAADALASWSAAGHRAALEAIYPRLDAQIEIATVAEIMAAWPKE